MKLRNAIILASLIAAATGMAMADSTAPLETVAHVDLGRYIGRWFEIARYPNRFQRNCDRDVTAEYSIKTNGNIRVVNACLTLAGKIEKVEGTAKIVVTSTNAKLKVSFFWPFYGNYWIIGLDEGYQYAVIGEPSRRYLWILSRSPAMRDSTYQELLRIVAEKGYEPQRLVRTMQTAVATAE